MNKLVYLYELDSVRNSNKEIEIGQQALFEEIVINGNRVVLTFNQLTDSEAFLSAVKNEKTYNSIIELFRLGAIRVSRFNNIRTASQYIQNSIDKCMENDTNTFLFSGLPVDYKEKELLELVKHSLQYSDPVILEEYLNNLKEDSHEDIKRIEYLIRFIKMILVLSTEAAANNPAKMENKRTFIEFLKKIYNSYSKYGMENMKEIETVLQQAIEVLKSIEQEFIIESGEEQALKSINNRSNWLKKLRNMEEEPKVNIAQTIINLCYNYTMEESICEVSKHYLENDDKMFWEDFQNRLSSYWNLYSEKQKIIPNENVEHVLELPDWALAVRIVKNKKEDTKNRKTILYEEGHEKDKKIWKRKLNYSILKRCGVAVIYICLFCIVQYIMGIIQGTFNFELMNLGIVSSILDIVCFGILGTLVSNWFNLPDILDSIKDIVIGIHDFFKYKYVKTGIAYKNINRRNVNEKRVV